MIVEGQRGFLGSLISEILSNIFVLKGYFWKRQHLLLLRYLTNYRSHWTLYVSLPSPDLNKNPDFFFLELKMKIFCLFAESMVYDFGTVNHLSL